MGAWGRGILQNDDAQDGLADLIHDVEDEIRLLAGRRPEERTAARLGAAVGLLLQMSAWYPFDPENEVSAIIHDGLVRQEPKWTALPRRAQQLLREVRDGKGIELAERPGKASRSVGRALFATPVGDFPTERAFGKREPSLFQHPQAARYVQEFADHCAAVAEETFKEEDDLMDITETGKCMAAFSTLLVLEPCRLAPRRIVSWRKRFEISVAEFVDEAGDLDEFDQEYKKCVDLAFRVMLKKYSRS
jgi:hypothetical protein